MQLVDSPCVTASLAKAAPCFAPETFHLEGNAMKQNPVGWFEIYVDNMPRAQRFYESVLRIEFEKLGDPSDSQVEMMAFPMGMGLPGAHWSKRKASKLAPTAPWSTSVAWIAPRKEAVLSLREAASSAKRCRSASMASSFWLSIPKATCSACIR